MDYQKITDTLKAIAHPTRLEIMDHLRHKDMCVSEISELFNLDQSTISKHLSILKNEGIISSTKNGNFMIYKLERSCLPGIMSCFTKFKEDNK